MEKFITIENAAKITGFTVHEIPLLIYAVGFPKAIPGETPMFDKARVMFWYRNIREQNITGEMIARMLGIANGIFICVCEDKSFPKPVAAYTNCLFSEWNLGEVLDWRKEHVLKS